MLTLTNIHFTSFLLVCLVGFFVCLFVFVCSVGWLVGFLFFGGFFFFFFFASQRRHLNPLKFISKTMLTWREKGRNYKGWSDMWP